MRAALRAAASAHLSGFSVVTQWGQSVDQSGLPAVGFFTPVERKSREAAGRYVRQTDIVALIRMSGRADLEDSLDAAADTVEAIAIAALEAILRDGDDVEVVSVDTDIPGVGEQRIGACTVTLRSTQLA